MNYTHDIKEILRMNVWCDRPLGPWALGQGPRPGPGTPGPGAMGPGPEQKKRCQDELMQQRLAALEAMKEALRKRKQTSPSIGILWMHWM